MPKRRQPLQDSQVAQDILSVLETYAIDAQFYPTQNGLYNHMRRMGYKHTIGSFNYWFSRLVEARKIDVDWSNTRAIRAVNLVIVDRAETTTEQEPLFSEFTIPRKPVFSR